MDNIKMDLEEIGLATTSFSERVMLYDDVWV
jgi:hypothetical protein